MQISVQLVQQLEQVLVCFHTQKYPETCLPHSQQQKQRFSSQFLQYVPQPWAFWLNLSGLSWCGILCKCAAPGFPSSLLLLLQFHKKRSAERGACLSVEGDLLQARPCQLWGTEVWPLRCLTSPVASRPASQLQYTAYLEHALNIRPTVDRPRNILYWWAQNRYKYVVKYDDCGAYWDSGWENESFSNKLRLFLHRFRLNKNTSISWATFW